MATGAARDGNVVKIALISYGHRTVHGQAATRALAALGYRTFNFIDTSQTINPATTKVGYPDRRRGGKVDAQRAVIKDKNFAAAVVECLKT